MLRIAVTFALRSEFAPWSRRKGFSRDRKSPLFRARMADSEVCVLLTGVGCRAGESELRKLLGNSDFCIAAGLAGGLNSQYPVAAILVAGTVKNDVIQEEFASDRQLVEIAQQCGAIRTASFLTTSSIVNSSVEKHRLAQAADAVDMESFHVFRQAREMGTPAVAVRALSDTAEQAIPVNLNPFINGRGDIDWIPAMREVTKAPQKIPQLIRFGVDSSRAARNLAVFLNRYITMLTDVARLRLLHKEVFAAPTRR